MSCSALCLSHGKTAVRVNHTIKCYNLWQFIIYYSPSRSQITVGGILVGTHSKIFLLLDVSAIRSADRYRNIAELPYFGVLIVALLPSHFMIFEYINSHNSHPPGFLTSSPSLEVKRNESYSLSSSTILTPTIDL